MKETRKIAQAMLAGICGLVMLLPVQAEARVGGLDLGYGTGGKVRLQSVVSDLTVAADGSVTYLGARAIRRVLADGQPDSEFGVGGSRPLDSPIEGLPFVPSGLAVDSQGRVVVFGAVTDPLHATLVNGSIGLESVDATWAVVLRFRPDGSPDPSFGEGKGFVRTDLGLRSELSISIPTTSVFSGAIDSQDRPVLLAGVANSYAACVGHSGVDPAPRAIVRLTTAGNTDPGFGGGDGVIPLEGRPTPLYSDLRVVGGGQPIAVVGSGGCRGPIAFRTDADGSPLPAFGADGILFRSWEFGAIDPSGALILKRGRPASEVGRVAPNGRLDRAIGKDGVVAVKMPRGLKRTLRPVGLDASGRMILAGSFVLPPKSPAKAGAQNERSINRRGFLLLMRLLPSGEPDRSFGRDGRIATPIGRNRMGTVQQAAIEPGGRLTLFASLSAPFEQVLARYLIGD